MKIKVGDIVETVFRKPRLGEVVRIVNGSCETVAVKFKGRKSLAYYSILSVRLIDPKQG